MNKKTISFLILLAMLGGAAQAQSHKKTWPNTLSSLRFGLYMAENNLFEARFILRVKGEIGLTPAQEQKIENVMLAHDETVIRRSSDIKVLELRFASLLKGNRIDRREMEKMARAMGQLKTDLQIDHLNYLLDLRDILTPEQVQKMEKMKKEIPERIRDKMRERRGNVPPPPPPDGQAEGADENEAI
ncbi:MAG TPA: Spy/CpxP family protein refolding chaperone [Candidatus Binatia bacterium]|nr:Spy/CpxP family protein refolding chaperone [Candidatus Binatia bacterium]